MKTRTKILAGVTAVLLIGLLVGAATAQQSLNRLERTGTARIHVPGLEERILFINDPPHFTSRIDFDVDGQLVSVDKIHAVVNGYIGSTSSLTVGDTTVPMPVGYVPSGSSSGHDGTQSYDITGAFSSEGSYLVDSWAYNSGSLNSIEVVVEYTYIPEQYLN